MNFVCFIPARGGSKGIPNKNLINFAGNPLLSWTIKQANASKHLFGKVYVSSNDNQILEIAKSFGAKTVLRPSEISSDQSSAEEALKHFVINCPESNFDAIVFLQCTSPLRETKDIDNAIETFLKNNYDSVFSATMLADFCIWRKNSKGQLESLNYDYKNRLRRQDKEEQYVENGSIYIFKKEILNNLNNRLGGNIGISIMDPWKVYEIDHIEDIELCEFYFKKNILKQFYAKRQSSIH